MLELDYFTDERFDEATSRFLLAERVSLRLEHSLLAIAQWESKWEVPFLSTEHTKEQILDYIYYMGDGSAPREVINTLPNEQLNEIKEYLKLKRSATTVPNRNTGGTRELITSELVYYWMTALNIPFDCERWNIQRLLTLIAVCNFKNQDPKKNKMSQRDLVDHHRAVNAERRRARGRA